MKKTSVSPSTSFGRAWRIVAVLSLATNLVLAVFLSRRGETPPAKTSTESKVSDRREITAVSAVSRDERSYAALGSFMAESNRIADLGWSAKQFAAFVDGLRSSYEGKGVPLDDDAKQLQASISKRVEAMLAAERPNPVEDYFRTLREKEGVLKTSSGLHYRITEPGAGPPPKLTDSVVISFAARLPDGEALPALTRARTRTVVRDLLPGLAEGVQLLRVGGKALVYLPPELAFSEESWPAQLPKNVPLAFFVELHEIEAAASNR